MNTIEQFPIGQEICPSNDRVFIQDMGSSSPFKNSENHFKPKSKSSQNTYRSDKHERLDTHFTTEGNEIHEENLDIQYNDILMSNTKIKSNNSVNVSVTVNNSQNPMQSLDTTLKDNYLIQSAKTKQNFQEKPDKDNRLKCGKFLDSFIDDNFVQCNDTIIWNTQFTGRSGTDDFGTKASPLQEKQENLDEGSKNYIEECMDNFTNITSKSCKDDENRQEAENVIKKINFDISTTTETPTNVIKSDAIVWEDVDSFEDPQQYEI